MKLNRQILNIIILLTGAGLLIYDLVTEGGNVYLKIIGLVLLMLGLYMTTRQWTVDNGESELEMDEEDEKNK